jgi:hypothetical protein
MITDRVRGGPNNGDFDILTRTDFGNNLVGDNRLSSGAVIFEPDKDVLCCDHTMVVNSGRYGHLLGVQRFFS